MFLNGKSDKCFNYFLFKRNTDIKIISFFRFIVSLMNTLYKFMRIIE